MIVWISGAFSIDMVVPRTFLLYLLTADWVTPRICATWFSFISCLSMRVCAKRALIEGETVLTATSQGVSNFPPDMVICWENIFKDAVCHRLYDVCPGGSSLLNLLSLPNPTFARQAHALLKKDIHENPRDPHRQQQRNCRHIS